MFESFLVYLLSMIMVSYTVKIHSESKTKIKDVTMFAHNKYLL